MWVNTQNTYFERVARDSAGTMWQAACNVVALNDAHCCCLEALPENLDLVGDLVGSTALDCRCRCRSVDWRRERRGTWGPRLSRLMGGRGMATDRNWLLV
jgi:hypothetical protein